MYVHIGKDNIIDLKDILMILNVSSIKETKEYLIFMEELSKENLIDNIKEENKKSLIIIKKEESIKAYFSNISSETLEKRAKEKM